MPKNTRNHVDDLRAAGRLAVDATEKIDEGLRSPPGAAHARSGGSTVTAPLTGRRLYRQ
jgi:hypothetical protein